MNTYYEVYMVAVHWILYTLHEIRLLKMAFVLPNRAGIPLAMVGHVNRLYPRLPIIFVLSNQQIDSFLFTYSLLASALALGLFGIH